MVLSTDQTDNKQAERYLLLLNDKVASCQWTLPRGRVYVSRQILSLLKSGVDLALTALQGDETGSGNVSS